MDNNSELAGQGSPLPAKIIVDEILSRLPVKSLLRFKCVSKPWRSLISNTNFITLHTKKAVDDRQVFLQRRRVMFNDYKLGGLYSIDLDQFLRNHADNPYEGHITATRFDFVQEIEESDPKQKQDRPSYIFFIYFCNNLVLCRTQYGLYLGNPATRELKRVPDTPTWSRPSPTSKELPVGLCVCGLGFDYTTNDYKVVHGQIYDDLTTTYGVYSLRADSWRQIECPGHYFPQPETMRVGGVFLNGALHWLASNAETGRSVILCFVLAEENFLEIQLPTIDDTSSAILGVFRDCVCVTLCGYKQTYDEFWVMKDYGMTTSWMKMRVFKPYTSLLSQIGFSDDSHDVMVYENSLVLLENFTEEDGRKLRIGDIAELGNCVGVYVEGLFPLLSDGSGWRMRSRPCRDNANLIYSLCCKVLNYFSSFF